jgi:hypothetical protein
MAGFAVMATPKTGLFWDNRPRLMGLKGLRVKNLSVKNLRFDNLMAIGDDFPAQGRIGEKRGKVGGWEKKRMKSVLRLWHALFRGFRPKASTDGLCPDAESAGTEDWTMNKLPMAADLQKRAWNGEISRHFKWMHLIHNTLRAFTEHSSQVVDFSPVMAIFHDFSPIFHPSLQLEELYFQPVIKITGFKRTLACEEKAFFPRNDRQRPDRAEFIHKSLPCFVNIVRFNQRNCS